MANLVTKKLNFSKLSTSTQLSSNLIRFVKDVDQNISSSPRFLNWVEPITLSGYIKSIFYTEIDSNLKKGDRVFIVNGNYDSDSLIDIDKYKIGRDGYKILDIDRCKITLDINYTGELPWIEDDVDNFIKVHYVKGQREFDYVNKQFISRDGFSNKFENLQNNFIYVDNSYNGLPPGIGENLGVPGPGFYVKIATSWVLISTDLLTNSLFFQSTYLSTNFSNNGRIKIINGNFTDINGKEWRESNIYKFDSTLNEWIVDVKYMRPFITKSNFRRGNFKGKWNKGIYGSYDEKISWMGTSSNWYNGTVINTEWKSGDVNSNFIPETSYFAEIDQFGLPVQKVNIANNRGYGYNYFIDMDMKSSTINNGNYINCNIGLTAATFSVSDRYYQQWNNTLDNTINLGEFNFCNIESSVVKNASIKGSRIKNTHIESSKSINSNLSDSVFYRSNYESDNLIKIQAYDEWNAHLDNTSNKWKIYKFYINEKDVDRLKSLDKFYIKGLKVNSDDYWTLAYEKLLNFFDRGFIMDSYSDSEDVKTTSSYIKWPIDFICKVSTREENTYKLSAYFDGFNYYTATYSLNDNQLPSIDVMVRIENNISFINGFFKKNDYNYSFDTDLSPGGTLSLIGNNIDFSDAYVIDSYFDSGLIEQSNWNSGSFYNYNTDTNIYGDFNNGALQISYSGGQLLLQLPDFASKGVKDDYYKVGDIVYLNGVDYNDGLSVTRLPNKYKVNNITLGPPGYNNYILDEYLIGTESSVISSLTGSGVFLTSPDGLTSSVIGTNRYNYLHKLRIDNSNIKSSILRRPFITNSIFYYDKFINSDYNFDDKLKLKEQVIIDSILSDDSNTIKSGLFVNSYFRKGTDNWTNGIVWRSMWESGSFNNGVFRESNWINGEFNAGMFFKSKSTPYINDIPSYYKSGIGQITNRFVWQNGTFNNGDFFDSMWESGTFKKGRMYKSSWTDGIFEDGLFGDVKFNMNDNNFFGGTFSNGVVVNSNFFASTQSYSTYTSSVFNGIHWKNGIFQSGVFGNDTTNSIAVSTWYNGTFNGGDFTNTSIWLDGTFNGGKFTSYYGSTACISNTQSDYTWQSGIFNGGEFGTADGITNSTWWNGEMYGGIFRGKIWNNGILISGEIQGSATTSCVGGNSASNASTFVDGFTNSYYGLWRDGIVTNVKDKFIKHKELFTPIIRVTDELKFTERVNKSKAVIKNSLWLAGTFSHQNGETNNVVWLDGTFDIGNFKNSSFNPYVKRNGSTQSSFNLSDSCIWKDGTFDGGDFYISNWEKGMFIMGTGHGMLWHNGTVNYMNAFNICWDDGLWRNGNWYGSPYEFNGTITDDYVKQILFRIMDGCTGTSSCHIWNIFDDSSDANSSIVNAGPSAPTVPGGGGGGGFL